MPAIVCIRSSGHSQKDLILPLYCMGPRDGIQISGLVARTFTH